jgi:hypothetical protein
MPQILFNNPIQLIHFQQSQPEKKPRIEDHELRHGGVDLPLPEKKQIRLPVFGARLFPFDVDQSPAVQQFESIQVNKKREFELNIY